MKSLSPKKAKYLTIEMSNTSLLGIIFFSHHKEVMKSSVGN